MHRTHKFAQLLPSLLFTLAILAGSTAHAGERPVVVTTFSLIADWVRAVGGDDIDLRNLTPVGAEVHEWELQPRNFMDLEEADLIFYNGLTLEQWMPQVEATIRNDTPLIPLAEQSGFPTLPIVTGEYSGDPDPHLWMNPAAVRRYIDVIEAHLVSLNPGNAQAYRERADAYRAALDNLDAEIRDILADIPEAKRTLITSEAAFIYFADTYNFFHDGIWGTNAEVEGSPRQIMRITDIVRERTPPVLFWESTISDRHVRSVAEDNNIDVAGPLYVDSLGAEGSGAESYIAMMRRNAELLRSTLGRADEEAE